MTTDGNAIMTLLSSVGLEDVEIDEDGIASVYIDDHLPIFLKIDPGETQLFVYAGIAELDDQRLAAASRTLLEANRAGFEAEGFTLGVASETDLVFLMTRFPLAELSSEEMFGQFNHFVDAAVAWQLALAEPASPENNDQSATDEQQDPMNIMHNHPDEFA
ncbi:MAG: type III secretion system chaperone [Pseudomonadota bacterium]